MCSMTMRSAAVWRYRIIMLSAVRFLHNRRADISGASAATEGSSFASALGWILNVVREEQRGRATANASNSSLKSRQQLK